MSFESEITDAIRALLRVNGNIEEESRAIVRDVAIWVRDESRARVPVDEGNTENAITYRIWSRKDGASASVYVDPEAPGGEDGVKPIIYAEWLHEGDYKLGRDSFRKQMMNPEVKVGNKFFERAISENQSDINKYVIRKLREALHK